jgi:hypothetical protein
MYDICLTCKKPIYPAGVAYAGQACHYHGSHPQLGSSSQIEQSLREMYQLGVEHGTQLTKRDMEIEQLTKELAALNDLQPKDQEVDTEVANA